MLRAASYSRVSRDEQRYNTSLPDQRRIIANYCAEKGYDLGVHLIFEDHKSGMRLDRPGLTALIDACRAGTVDVIVCLDLSRLTRHQDHHGYLRTLFAQGGGKVEFVRQQVSDDPAGRLMLDFYGFGNTNEWNTTRQKTWDGLRAKAMKGMPIGRVRPPFGLAYNEPEYHADGKPVKDTVRTHYLPHPTNAVYVAPMFEKADEGLGLWRIAGWLDSLGVQPPYADRPDSRRKPGYVPKWSASSVRHILTNRVYVGELVQFKVKVVEAPRKRTGGVGTAKTRVAREIWNGEGSDEGKALRAPAGVVPRLVSDELFARVQRRLAQNAEDKALRSVRADRDDAAVGLLRQRVRCPVCGCGLSVWLGARGGPEYRHPTNQSKRHGCPPTSMQVARLDADIWQRIRLIRRDPRKSAALFDRLRGEGGDGGRAAAMHAAAVAHLDELTGRRSSLIDNLERVSGSAADDVIARIDRMAGEIAGAEATRDELAQVAGDADGHRRRVERSVAAWEAAPADLDGLDIDGRRRLLADLGATVTLHPAASRSRWRLSFEDEIEVEGERYTATVHVSDRAPLDGSVPVSHRARIGTGSRATRSAPR